MIGLIFQKELMLTKQLHQKSVIFVILGTFYMKNLIISHIFAMAAMI